jgi:hypothetical protein
VTSSGIARNGFFLDRIADEAAARAEGMDGSVAMLGEMVETMDQVLSSARDTGDVFNDLSVAIYAGGRHYGALSVAYPAQTS